MGGKERQTERLLIRSERLFSVGEFVGLCCLCQSLHCSYMIYIYILSCVFFFP